MRMRLRERKRAFFEQEGYLVVRGFFEAEEISRVREAQDAFYRGEINEIPEFSWPKPRKTEAKSRKHPYASFFRREMGELIRDGRLGVLIREVANLESVRYWHDQLLFEEGVQCLLLAGAHHENRHPKRVTSHKLSGTLFAL